MALGGAAGHQMAAALFPVHRGGCTYLLWFFGSDLPPYPFPSPAPLLLLPFLYAVMQADVGLFCCVLLSLSLSLSHPSHLTTFQHQEERKKKRKEKKLHMQYMDYEKSVKINTFKKKLNVLQFFFIAKY